MKNIELLISESIKTGKWLDISYKNKNNEITYYWIAINDIDLKNKIINANIFNDKKSLDCLNVNIYFDNILTAKLLDFTTYEVNENLIKKIETNKDDASWLKYEYFDNNILKYYIECNKLDNDPYQVDSCLLDGIDVDLLLKERKIQLNDEQVKYIIRYIYNYDINDSKYHNNEFIINILAIDNSNKKYVLLYHKVDFNALDKTIVVDPTIRINQSFLIDGKRHSISNYIDVNTEIFVERITQNYYEYIDPYREYIRSNLRNGETLNELPEFMILQREIPVSLEPTYNVIENEFVNSNLEFPLKAFFKSLNRRGAKRNEPHIILYDRKVNIDQMRVIYNTMKNPITYVQGPPGTGKTQTILNVILSAFFNSKNILITSSNNKPVDGIIEKLSFSYRKENDIPFPYLRLGNRLEILKALDRIKELFEFNIVGSPIEYKIDKIKDNNIKESKKLLEALEIYEKKKELKEKIDYSTKLLHSLTNYESHLYKNTRKQLNILLEEYNGYRDVTNEEVLNLVVAVSESHKFKQYLYFESAKYIKKLKLPRYKELISICYMQDEEEKTIKFNKWCAHDGNIKLLKDAFPIIMTTNISSSKLGTAKHKFDLVIMDEAGQSNCATALLPIARAKSLLLVGDTNQLKPVILLEDNVNEQLKYHFNISSDFDYNKNSILELMRRNDPISKDIMLTYHYRCGRKIINFSNKRFYDNKLNLDNLSNEGNISLLDVKNVNSKLRNQNYEEAEAIVNYIKRNNIKDAAIITPFVNQQMLINQILKYNNITDIKCGTIHSVQGAEKDTIIISSSISPKTSKKTFEWLKNNAEITNVAVTRAKKNLIVVTDTEALEHLSEDKKDDLYNLVKYIRSNGNVEIEPNESKTIQIGSSNGSLNEDIFFETISHFCTIYNYFQVKRNVKLSTIFNSDPILKQSRLEFDIVLYSIENNRQIPKIAIELQGGEHFGDYNREKCDARKAQICKEKNIKLIAIPNSYVKAYETVKQLILTSCGQQIEQLTLF